MNIPEQESTLQKAWRNLSDPANRELAETIPALYRSTRHNLGSMAQDGATFGDAWKPLWSFSSSKHRCQRVLISPLAVLLGCCDEESTPDYYDEVDHEVLAVHPGTGKLLHRFPKVELVGVNAGVAFCATPLSVKKILEGRCCWSGKHLWRRDAPGNKFLVGPASLFCWMGESRSSRDVWISDIKDPTLGPEIWRPVPSVPCANVGYVHARSERFCVSSWQQESTGQRAVIEIRNSRTLEVTWSHEFTEYTPHDLLLDDHGWVLCSGKETLACDLSGQTLWTGPDFNRAWSSPDWVVGETYRSKETLVVNRRTGLSRSLPVAPDTRSWDLAITGDRIWRVERKGRKLTSFDANTGELVTSVVQPGLDQLGPYGIRRLIPYGRSTFLQSGIGAVWCVWVSSRSPAKEGRSRFTNR